MLVSIAETQGPRKCRSPSRRTEPRCLVAVQTKAIGTTVGEAGLGGALWLLWLWWQRLLAFGCQRTRGHPLREGNQRHHAALLFRKDGRHREMDRRTMVGGQRRCRMSQARAATAADMKQVQVWPRKARAVKDESGSDHCHNVSRYVNESHKQPRRQ